MINMAGREEARLIMEMIGELHRMGYGKLKILCYVKEGIGQWRSKIFASDRWDDQSRNQMEPSVFEWRPFGAESAKQASLKFLEASSHRELLKKALGQDPVYVEWYAEMLKRTAPDGVLEMERPDDIEIHGGPNGLAVQTLVYWQKERRFETNRR